MNFKKNGIFGRREDGGQREAEYDGYGSPNQVLAVWGSPGSGKTTVAVKLAKYLAGKKKNSAAAARLREDGERLQNGSIPEGMDRYLAAVYPKAAAAWTICPATPW